MFSFSKRLGLKKQMRFGVAGELVQWAKVFAAEPNDLTLYVMWNSHYSCKFFSDFYSWAVSYAHT